MLIRPPFNPFMAILNPFVSVQTERQKDIYIYIERERERERERGGGRGVNLINIVCTLST